MYLLPGRECYSWDSAVSLLKAQVLAEHLLSAAAYRRALVVHTVAVVSIVAAAAPIVVGSGA